MTHLEQFEFSFLLRTNAKIFLNTCKTEVFTVNVKVKWEILPEKFKQCHKNIKKIVLILNTCFYLWIIKMHIDRIPYRIRCISLDWINGSACNFNFVQNFNLLVTSVIFELSKILCQYLNIHGMVFVTVLSNSFNY